MDKKIYLIIETKSPKIFENLKEAESYLGFVRDTDKEHKKLKAMYCSFTTRHFKEVFINCTFQVL